MRDIEKIVKKIKSKSKWQIKSLLPPLKNYVLNAILLHNPYYFDFAQRQIENSYNQYLSKIRKKQKNIKDRLSNSYETSEDKIENILRKIFQKNPTTIEEKKKLYDFYVDNYKDETIPPFEQINNNDFLNIFMTLYMSFLSRQINKMKKKIYSYSYLVSLDQQFEKVIDVFTNDRDNYCLFSLDKKYISEVNIKVLKEYCLKAIQQNKNVRVVINSDMNKQNNNDIANYLYNSQQLSLLTDLQEFLSNYGPNNDIRFNEFQQVRNNNHFNFSWSLIEVLRANAFVSLYVKKIKESNLSPFETVLFLNKELSQIKYQKSCKFEDDKVIVGFVNRKMINCAGYSSLFKAIIDKLNDKNLKVELIGCEFVGLDDKKLLSHTHNLVHLNDNKYNIHGTFAYDLTFNANSQYAPYDMTYCLFPIQDLSHLKYSSYIQKFSDNRLYNIIVNKYALKASVKKGNRLYKLAYKIQKFFKVLSKPQVVKRYKNQQVIPVQAYKSALLSLINKDKDFIDECDDKNKFIDEIINNTIINSKLNFNQDAVSSFVQAEMKSSKEFLRIESKSNM